MPMWAGRFRDPALGATLKEVIDYLVNVSEIGRRCFSALTNDWDRGMFPWIFGLREILAAGRHGKLTIKGRQPGTSCHEIVPLNALRSEQGVLDFLEDGGLGQFKLADGTEWRELRFDVEQVVAIWPDEVVEKSAQHDDPERALREIREQGATILTALVHDIDPAQAVARERVWAFDLISAVAPWGEAWQARFEPIGVPSREERDFAEEHVEARVLTTSNVGGSTALLTNDDVTNAIYCHAVRMFRLEKLLEEIAVIALATSGRPKPVQHHSQDGPCLRVTGVVEANANESTAAPRPDKATIEWEYRVRVEQARQATGRPPKRADDFAWGQAKGLRRERVRELRAGALTPNERRGGAPKRTN